VNFFAQALWTRRHITELPTGDGLTLEVPSSNPFYVNPAGGSAPVTVLYGSTPDFGAPLTANQIDTGNFSLGVGLPLAGGWVASLRAAYTYESQNEAQRGQVNQVALDAALADRNPATAFNPFGDGSYTNAATLAAIVGTGAYSALSGLATLSASATGALLPLPGGEVQLSVGSEFRRQTFSSTTTSPTPGSDTSDSLGRHMFAGFTDLHLPLVGRRNSRPLLQRLELSFGERDEHFSDVGGASAPKLGLLYAPLTSLALRATWAKSFKPPNLTDMAPANSYFDVTQLADSASPTGLSTALIRYGTNPQLAPERAVAKSIGVDFTPSALLPGFGASLTYFNFDYTDRVDEEPISPFVLESPEYGWLVNRNFTAAQVSAVCNQSVPAPTSAACSGTAIAAIIDNRLRNIATLKTSGIDLLGKYRFASALGRFELGLNGTYLLQYSQANTPGSPFVSLLNTQNYPINLRLRQFTSWTLRGVSVSGFVNYQNSYRDVLSVPVRPISAWTTLDLQVAYQTGRDSSSWLGNLQLAISAQNVFDRYPPFLNNPLGVGYDQENADLYGRIVSVDVVKRW
jgi:iron complex outermembrane recepter protein